MTVEPTDQELDEIEEGEDLAMEFTDSMIYMETGDVLITRILKNVEEGTEGTIVLYKPAQLAQNYEGELVLTDWMPLTDDQYIFLPLDRIVTIANPKPQILEAYHTSIGVTEHAYLPEGETLH